MKIVVAPDKFQGSLTASEAAQAISRGWHRTNPDAEIIQAPMSDGGPGFLDVLSHALGGSLQAGTVTGPLREPVPACMLEHESTVYLESAQACGLSLVENPDPLRASSYGVGELIGHAVDAGVTRIVLGVGGTATNDGGAGLLAALGATADRPLDQGPQALDGITSIDLAPAMDRVKGCELIIASDVDTVLLGMFGATKMFGPQKGLSDEEIIRVDRILDSYVVAMLGSTPAERRAADAPGTGSGGGIGFALSVLGGEMVSGIDLVNQELALGSHEPDLFVTGEGRFDYSSRAGKVAYGVAQIAAAQAKPCIVLAGEVDVGSREMRALGIESAYGLTERLEPDEAMSHAAEHLANLAERVARSWTW